jgi:hypothetical protein
VSQDCELTKQLPVIGPMVSDSVAKIISQECSRFEVGSVVPMRLAGTSFQ